MHVHALSHASTPNDNNRHAHTHVHTPTLVALALWQSLISPQSPSTASGDPSKGTLILEFDFSFFFFFTLKYRYSRSFRVDIYPFRYTLTHTHTCTTHASVSAVNSWMRISQQPLQPRRFSQLHSSKPLAPSWTNNTENLGLFHLLWLWFYPITLFTFRKSSAFLL